MTEVISPPPMVTLNQEGAIPLNGSPQFGRSKGVLNDSSVDVFRTCADPG